MKNTLTTSEQLASHLLQIEAIKINIDEPFTWASGIRSPIYCDNRKILSFPEVRKYVSESLSNQVKQRFGEAEVIAGVATGAIAHGVLVAGILNLPFVYVRSTKKSHGLGNQIEGYLEPGKKIVVIEDLISTGQSSLSAVDALINAQAEVLGMVAIFTYGLPQATQNMQQAKISLFTLSDFDTLIQQAIREGLLHHSKTEILESWKQNPHSWKAP
ncbi:MAG: orotate phosphoribosyltransferase [Bacteroidales bacterium]